MFKLLRNSNYVLRLQDGAFIPPDDRNADFQDYLRWRAGWTENLEDGTEIVHPPQEPEPADAAPPPSQEEIEAVVAHGYPKLVTLVRGPRDEVLASIDAISNLTQARDVLKTLVIAIRVLARRI